ncbi:MAG: alpha/beta hydrolase [Erysipelotrichaceae bacterium]|nr:alpha/beta hydrolase [Erysipelotrichaceae bacterium]
MIKSALKVILILLLLIMAVPYVIPLSKYQPQSLPYENSYYFIGASTIHYRVYKPKQDTILGKILFIHGLGGSTFSYEKNAPILAEAGYLVITVDLPGFGYSDRNVNEDHAQTARAEQLWQLLDKLDESLLVENMQSYTWHIGGHSMGGGTAAAMAYLRQDDVASIILIDGALFETNRSSALITSPFFSRLIQVLLEHVVIKPKRIESFLTSAYGQTPTSDQILGYYTPLSLPGTARSALALLKTAKNISDAQLKTLVLPILAIWGENDNWVKLDTTTKIKELMPQTQVSVIKDAGHVPMETHPDDFNHIFLDWLTNK